MLFLQSFAHITADIWRCDRLILRLQGCIDTCTKEFYYWNTLYVLMFTIYLFFNFYYVLVHSPFCTTTVTLNCPIFIDSTKNVKSLRQPLFMSDILSIYYYQINLAKIHFLMGVSFEKVKIWINSAKTVKYKICGTFITPTATMWSTWTKLKKKQL